MPGRRQLISWQYRKRPSPWLKRLWLSVRLKGSCNSRESPQSREVTPSRCRLFPSRPTLPRKQFDLIEVYIPFRNLGDHRVSPVEIERAYREISNPVETEFGTVFTSPRSQIPLESRFATDLAMAHPKSRTRRQAAIRRAEEEAQREAASKSGTSVLPATPPNVIQIGTVDHSRESSILEEIEAESSSVYL